MLAYRYAYVFVFHCYAEIRQGGKKTRQDFVVCRPFRRNMLYGHIATQSQQFQGWNMSMFDTQHLWQGAQKKLVEMLVITY